ncbi:MAG: hypothetical protein R3C44_04540 [Chloroflexota bacterium]
MRFKRLIKGLGIGLLALVAVIGGLILYWLWRPNQAQIDPTLVAEVWPAVRNGLHNSNTDLIFWQDHFYLVHAQSPYHMGNTESRLIVRRSADAREWEQIAELQVPDEDIRDPKLAVIHDTLFLYALENSNFEPEPFSTVLSTSNDGVNWSALQEIDPQGWLLWRPKTPDGETWYATAYWHEHGKSALFKSSDGQAWEFVSAIHEGDRNDETALEFLPGGRMLVTARLEGDDRAWHQGSKNAATLLAWADSPYTDWTTTRSQTSRLDGPVLFSYEGQVYAVGRFDPEGLSSWYGMSSVLGRKRTAIYRVTQDALIRLTDLPSNGDTSYAGAVLKDGDLFISYYTNDPNHDYPWVLGLIRPSDVMIARVPLDALARAQGLPSP